MKENQNYEQNRHQKLCDLGADKLIADVQYRAGLMGITEKDIQNPLPQSTSNVEFYDIAPPSPIPSRGTPSSRRKRLVHYHPPKGKDSDYPTAYKYILEEVAYTWFNRLIAIRFMEVNDYLPSHIRVLSSESGMVEPDLVTTPFDAGLDFTPDEEQAPPAAEKRQQAGRSLPPAVHQAVQRPERRPPRPVRADQRLHRAAAQPLGGGPGGGCLPPRPRHRRGGTSTSKRAARWKSSAGCTSTTTPEPRTPPSPKRARSPRTRYRPSPSFSPPTGSSATW